MSGVLFNRYAAILISNNNDHNINLVLQIHFQISSIDGDTSWHGFVAVHPKVDSKT